MPITIVYAALAGVTPSLIWLFFWLREDRIHPEPKSLLAACFFGGMLAVLASALAENYAAGFIHDDPTLYTIWAAIEEILKLLAVIILAFGTQAYDEPIDAMIYCITCALGFAALENTLFLIDPLSNGKVLKTVITGNMRFIGATLVHVVCSAIIGFSVGMGFYRRTAAKFFLLICGILAAITIHAAFNLSVIGAPSSGTLKAFAWIWGGIVMLIILFEEIKAVRPKLL